MSSSLNMLADVAENNAVIQRAHNEEARYRRFNTVQKRLNPIAAQEINRQFAALNPKAPYQLETFPNAGNEYDSNATTENASNSEVVQPAPAPRAANTRKRQASENFPLRAAPSVYENINGNNENTNPQPPKKRKTGNGKSRRRNRNRNRKNRATLKRKTTRTSA